MLYLICSMILMVNMLGYFLGHYPQTFNLTDSQRTLILQTMCFFIWLAGGGAVFSVVQTRFGGPDDLDWSFVDAVSPPSQCHPSPFSLSSSSQRAIQHPTNPPPPALLLRRHNPNGRLR